MPKPIYLLLLVLMLLSQQLYAQDISVKKDYPVPALPQEGFVPAVFEVQRLRNEDMEGIIEHQRGMRMPTEMNVPVSLRDNRTHIYRVNAHVTPFRRADDPMTFRKVPFENSNFSVRMSSSAIRWGRSVIGLTTMRGTISSRLMQFDQILDRPTGNWGYSSSPTTVQVIEHTDPKQLPYSWIGYDLLQAMVIEDFPYTEFDPAQVDAIVQWVERGGTLLVSPGNTGASLQSTLVRRLVNLTLNGQSKADFRTLKNVTRWDFTVEGARDLEYAKAAQCGSGHVVLFHYDILREPFSQWQGLNPMLSTLPVIRAASGVSRTEYPINWRREEENLPSPLTIAMILGLYLVVVGPANYLFLRVRKRLVLMPFSIAGIAVAFTVSIIAYGYISRGVSTELKEMAVIQTFPDRSGAFARQQIAIYASSNRPFELAFGRDVALRRVADENEMNGSESSPLEVIDNGGETLTAKFSALMWKDYKIEAQQYLPQFGNLSCSINGNNVTVFNNSDLALSECWINNGGRWYRIGGAPAKGQTAARLTMSAMPPMRNHIGPHSKIIGKVADGYIPIEYDMTSGRAQTVLSETYLAGGVR